MPPSINTINQASLAAASLPETIHVALSSGVKLKLKRLSWIAFEALWPKLTELLLDLWPDSSGSAAPQTGTAQVEAEPGPATLDRSARLSQRLVGIPGLLSELLCHCSELSAEEIAELPLCDVLALGAAALRLNFIETAGLRDFFAALGELAN